MVLRAPDKIQNLQRKLYLKAKSEPRHKVPSRGISRFPSERVFRELGVMLPRPIKLVAQRVP